MRLTISAALAVAALAFAAPGRSRADEAFSLVINPFTGAASLRNDRAASVDLDSYLLTSAGAAVLNPAGWDSLEDDGALGWRESAAAGNRLGELNLFGSLAVAPGSSVDLGNPYTPFAPTAFGQTEPGLAGLKFTYSAVGAGPALAGDVEFAVRNTIVLVIDPATGAAALQNQSAFNVNLDGYLIKSGAGVLDVAGWAPLSASNSSWASAPGQTNRIAEGNLFGSTLLAANGGSLALGQPIDPDVLDDEKDLALEFSVAGGASLAGGVLFASGPSTGPSADFNGDGFVTGADLGNWKGGFGAPGARVNGDADGNSLVDGRDFLIWQRQLGAGGATSTNAASSVPEPAGSSIALSIAAATTLRPRRGRRRRAV